MCSDLYFLRPSLMRTLRRAYQEVVLYQRLKWISNEISFFLKKDLIEGIRDAFSTVHSTKALRLELKVLLKVESRTLKFLNKKSKSA